MSLRYAKTFKLLSAVFSLLYAGFLIYAVFFARRRRHLEERFLNLVPIKTMIEDFRQMPAMGMYNFYTNLLGNIVLFIPIPFILIVIFRMHAFLSIMLTGFLVSFTIESIQYIFEVGVADVNDLLLNTMGTAIGYVCWLALKRMMPAAFSVHA